MEKIILYASSNAGKLLEANDFFNPHGIKVVGPKDLGITIDVDETGTTVIENAELKADAFAAIAHKKNPDLLIVGDDSGLEIDALNGEPGIYVKRWRDKKNKMSDKEIMSYCIERMQGIPKGKRQARFHCAAVLIKPNGEKEKIHGYLDGEILEQPSEIVIPGFPIVSLFYVPEWQMNLAQFHELSQEEQKKYQTHRGIVLRKILEKNT